ncbi:MAG: hypothetical protein WEG36_12180 [Gemmatimonadota bacterium]
MRGVRHVHAIPEGTVGFYFGAAKAGAFVWRDRDGTPWHLSAKARAVSETGRTLEVRLGESHRAPWKLTDGELGELVGMAVR